MFRHSVGLLFVCLFVAAGSAHAAAQEIVTDPELNARLVAYQENFEQFIADHPALSMGTTRPIELSGKKGKIGYTYSMQGAYEIGYGSLTFSAVSPIAASRFVATLVMDETVLTGDSHITITRKGRTYDLDCPNNEISVGRTVYTATVEILEDGTVAISNVEVAVDAKSISVTVPCLTPPKGVAGEGDGFDELDLESLIAVEVGATVGETIAAAAALPGGAPNQKVLKKTNAGLQKTAQSGESDVVTETATTARTAGNAMAAGAASPCSEAIYADVELVIADLAAISAQANDQGFSEAIAQFATDLEAILPTLSAPAQESVETLIADLEAFTSESSQGGTTITPLEEARLIADLYAVILSTGISSTDLLTLQNDLAAVLGTLEGISTEQLQADLQQLVLDAQECLAP